MKTPPIQPITITKFKDGSAIEQQYIPHPKKTKPKRHAKLPQSVTSQKR
jgi:hypothetical protein